MKVSFAQEFNAFNFEDLSRTAKDNAKEWLLESDEERGRFELDCLLDTFRYDYDAPDCDLQAALSYCQGDGLNIFGEISVSSCLILLLKLERDKFCKRIEFYAENVSGSSVKMPQNRHYTYSMLSRENAAFEAERWIDELQEHGIRGIDESDIHHFIWMVYAAISDIERAYYNVATDRLFNMDDEEAQSVCDHCLFWFDENGRVINELTGLEELDLVVE